MQTCLLSLSYDLGCLACNAALRFAAHPPIAFSSSSVQGLYTINGPLVRASSQLVCFWVMVLFFIVRIY